MQIDPRHLRVLLAIGRNGTFTAAAEALAISQPSVSAAVSQLEYILGVQLFERGRQGAVPTKAGLVAMRRAEALEQLLANTTLELQLVREAVEGPLAIGGTPGALHSLLPTALLNLRREAPRVLIQIREAADAELHDMLRAGAIDVALSTVGLGAVPDDIVEQVITDDRFVVVSGQSTYLPRGRSTKLSELADNRWILPDASGAFRRQIEAIFLTAGIPMPIDIIRSDSLAMTREIIRLTDYITILPWRVVASDVERGGLRVTDIDPAPPTRKIGYKVLAASSSAPVIAQFTRSLMASVIEAAPGSA